MTSFLANKIRSSALSAWSWWWVASNNRDELAKAILTVCLAVALISWYIWVTKKSTKGKLPLPPGPRGLPLVGNLPFIDPELHHYFTKLNQTYGPIIKLQLGSKLCIVLGSPSLAKEVLKDQDTSFANRDAPASALVITYGGVDMAWSSYGPNLQMLRKVCVREILSSSRLNALYDLRRREVHRTIHGLFTKVGTPINIGELTFVTLLNVITSLLWGDTLKGEEGINIGREFRQVVEEGIVLLGKTNVSDLFPALARFDIQGIERKMKRILLWVDRIFDSIIDQRVKMDQAVGENEKNIEEKKDFLQVLLHLKDQGDTKTPFTLTHLKAVFMDIVTGGTDTTSTTVEWAIAEIMSNPEIMKRIQDELDDVVGRNHMVEESHIAKLHYLNAVVKETLRLHPAVPFLVPRCPNVDCTVGGYTIPKGAQVLVNAWKIQRDPEAWENPLEFRPERFLMETDKWDFKGNDFHYFPFGSGRRVCIGIPLVERMLPYVLASLLHSFEWGLPEGTDLDLSEKFGILLKKKTPLIVIPTPRLSEQGFYC